MNFTIYAIGDASFLEDVLIAISAYTGTGNFELVGSIGLMLAVIIGGFSGIIQGGKGINYPQVIASFILFQIMFGPTADVVVEDVYTGQARPVGDVPLGVAVTGQIISGIGYSVTKDFEQAFSTPSMTQNGFGGALEVVKRIRVNNFNRHGLGNFNEATPGADFAESWRRYIKECTTTAITLDARKQNGIENGSTEDGVSVMDAFKFSSAIYPTQLELGGWGGSASPLMCTEAHAILKQYSQEIFLPMFKAKYLAEILGSSEMGVDSLIADSLRAIGIPEPESGLPIQDEFIMATILEGLYFKAWQTRHMDDRAFSYATAVDDAIRQREAQWLGQSSLFREFVHPIMTFVEGFMFSITPFMGFVLAMGEHGIKLAAKYLYLLIWVQLWTPVTAIVNFYIHKAITGQFDNIAGADINLYSVAGMMHADKTLMKYIATGEMLASSVPALTLVLLYGSSYTMTNLSSRMNASDTFDEKKVSADSYNAAPMMQQASMLTANQKGVHFTGAPDLNAGMSWTNTNTSAVKSAETEAAASGKSLVNSFQTALESGYSRGNTFSHAESETIQSSLGSSEAFGFANKHMSSVSDKWSNADAQVQKAAVAASLGFDVGGWFGLKGSGEAQTSMQEVQELSADLKSQFDKSDSFQSEFSSKVANDIQEKSGYTLAVQTGGKETEAVQAAAQDTLNKSSAYEAAVSNAQATGNSSTVDYGTISKRLADAGYSDDLVRMANTHGLNTEMQGHMNRLSDQIVDNNQRQAAAALFALEGSGSHAAMHASDQMISNVLSSPSIASVSGDASQNQGISGLGDGQVATQGHHDISGGQRNMSTAISNNSSRVTVDANMNAGTAESRRDAAVTGAQNAADSARADQINDIQDRNILDSRSVQKMKELALGNNSN